MLKRADELWYIYLIDGLVPLLQFFDRVRGFGVIGVALSKWTSGWRRMWISLGSSRSCWRLVLARVVCAVPECWGRETRYRDSDQRFPTYHITPIRVSNLNFEPLMLTEADIHVESGVCSVKSTASPEKGTQVINQTYSKYLIQTTGTEATG